MTRQQRVFSVVFVGEPYSNAIMRGTLDAANGEPAMEYQIIVPAEGAVRSHQAVVMIPNDKAGQLATTLLYRWDRERWNALPGVSLTRVR